MNSFFEDDPIANQKKKDEILLQIEISWDEKSARSRKTKESTNK
jgi:hypothetical protein